MNNITRILLATVFAGAASVPALADDTPYGAVDIGQTTGSNICTGAGAVGCKNNAGALRVALGYQFVPQMGAEISYGAYGKASLGTVGGAVLGDWKASGFALHGIGALPLGNGFSLTAKIGLASTKLDISGTGRSATSTNLAYGVGARYDFNRDVAMRVQYESLGDVGDANTGTSKLNLLSAGVVVRF